MRRGLWPCWSKALFCSSRIWWKTVAMSGRASTDSMKSSAFGVCGRRRGTVRPDTVSRLGPGHEERKGWSLPRGKCAGSPGLGAALRFLPDGAVVWYRCSRSPARNQRDRRWASVWIFSSFAAGGGLRRKGKHHHRQRGERRRTTKEARKFLLRLDIFFNEH